MIAEKQQKKYIEDGANNCPFCDSDDIYEGQSGFGNSYAYRNINCHDCFGEWTENFSITSIEDNSLNLTKEKLGNLLT